MELNRDHYFMIGLVLLLLGIQFRCVDSFQLNAETTKFLAKKMNKEPVAVANPLAMIVPDAQPIVSPKKTFKPPKWVGWALISVGSVLVLQSLGMRKPGG